MVDSVVDVVVVGAVVADVVVDSVVDVVPAVTSKFSLLPSIVEWFRRVSTIFYIYVPN